MFWLWLSFAVVSFIISTNFFPSLWHSLIAGVVIFFVTMLATTYKLDVLLYVEVGIISLALIGAMIANRK